MEAYDAGTVRKLSFESKEEMEKWLDSIREVTVTMMMEWDEGSIEGRQTSGSIRASKVIREEMAEQPKPNYDSAALGTIKKRKNILTSDRSGLTLLKNFQVNQMHGNFNEMVTTFITEESEVEKTATEIQDVEVVKFELDVTVPSFEVEIMKLKLAPGTNTVTEPAIFEKWVTYSMIGMSMWLE